MLDVCYYDYSDYGPVMGTQGVVDRGQSSRDIVAATMAAKGNMPLPTMPRIRGWSPRKRVREEIIIQEGTSYLHEID